MNKIKNNLEINNKNEKKIKNKSKLKKFVLILVIILIIILAIKTAISINKWQTVAKQMIVNQPSKVLDSNGEIIAEIGSERNRENVTIEKMPENLKNAYVAIEDERFYKHFGIDIKRTVAAIGSYVIHFGDASFGASTITQQLVKNLTGNDSNSISRKIQEWAKAVELEWCMDKNEILEAYLNIIYVGPNIYGVEKGAEYYFDKNVEELDLSECAFLAGINNAPNAYNPFNEEKDNSEKIQKRTKTVLNKMLEKEYISENDYNNAISEIESGLKFKKGNLKPDSDGVYTYHTDAMLTEVISDLAKDKNISKVFATNYLYMANLKIYSTQSSDIQEKMEKEFEKNKYILKSSDGTSTSQSAMVIIDNKTGYVIGCTGGLGKKTESRGFNRATQAIRQTGSSSKPLAVIIPALDKKIITPVSEYDDEQTTFIDSNNEEYSPTNYNNYLGKITVRRAIESSQNIPFVKIMEQITPATSIKYLKMMGITTLNERDENLSLALGGIDNGISPLEMAGAYATIANNGTYIEPTFYEKITTSNGQEILKTKQETRKVFSESVAYVAKSLLTQPVKGSNGTANYCAIKGMDVAAKTGTTNEDYDRWLCGFTNYYTAVTWFGYDLSEPIRYNGKNPAGLIWSSVMSSIHAKLENSSFEKPKGVITQTICKKTMQIANTACKDTFEECFVKGTEPGICTVHKGKNLQNTVISENTTKNLKDTITNTIQDVKENINSQNEQPINPEPVEENQSEEVINEGADEPNPEPENTNNNEINEDVVENTTIQNTNVDNASEEMNNDVSIENTTQNDI